ncbi:MAG: response regulator [Candidatus Zixiibacteriota bacterium]
MANILVVDDEVHIRKLYEEFFGRDNHAVMSAATAQEAFDIMAGNSFDLVILDVELKNESGLQILKNLKTEYPEIPVVLNSAYSIYKSDFGSWLADAYVLKSSDLEPLKEKIDELIGISCKKTK